MKASIELLVHYRCDNCNRWFNSADIAVQEEITCMFCSHRGKVTLVQPNEIQQELIEKLIAQKKPPE